VNGPPILRPPSQPLRVPTPLARANRLLAQPIAALFLVLGVAPGQLSLQSLTLTAVGLLRMADGTWSHVLLGAAIVYLGLLADRADLLIMERKGRPAPWTLFLGLAIDRLVEGAVVVGLGALVLLGVAQSPFPPLHLLTEGWTLVACAAAVGLLLGARALEAMAETLMLRTHLLATRRLPGTTQLSGRPPTRSFLAPMVGRDETILLACLAAAFNQMEVGLLVIAALQALAFLEQLVLFRQRLKDSESEASRILGPDYP
jgi:hypothetical protein